MRPFAIGLLLCGLAIQVAELLPNGTTRLIIYSNLDSDIGRTYRRTNLCFAYARKFNKALVAWSTNLYCSYKPKSPVKSSTGSSLPTITPLTWWGEIVEKKDTNCKWPYCLWRVCSHPISISSTSSVKEISPLLVLSNYTAPSYLII